MGGQFAELLADVVAVGLPPRAMTDAGEGGAACVDGFLIGTPPMQCRREPPAIGAVPLAVDMQCLNKLLVG